MVRLDEMKIEDLDVSTCYSIAIRRGERKLGFSNSLGGSDRRQWR
jgi:hypothetical protein